MLCDRLCCVITYTKVGLDVKCLITFPRQCLFLRMCLNLKYFDSSNSQSQLQVPYGWNAGVLFNLAVLGPCYVILYYSHESPLFVQSKGNRTLALSLAAKCGMTIEVQS